MSTNGKLADVQLSIWSDEFINDFGELDDCHKHSAKTIVQIHHTRMRTLEVVFANIVGSSDMITPSSKGSKEISARALTPRSLLACKMILGDALHDTSP